MPLETLPYSPSATIQVQKVQNVVVDYADNRTRYGRKKGPAYYTMELSFNNRTPTEFHLFEDFYLRHYPDVAFYFQEPLTRTLTTGSISNGSNQLTVASTATMAAQQQLSIDGAGSNGGSLIATITAINGQVLTLSANASSSTAGAKVHRLIKLEAYFTSRLDYQLDVACAVSYRVSIEGKAVT